MVGAAASFSPKYRWIVWVYWLNFEYYAWRPGLAVVASLPIGYAVWRTKSENYKNAIKLIPVDQTTLEKPASLNNSASSTIVSNTAAFNMGVGLSARVNNIQTAQTLMSLKAKKNQLQLAEKTLQAPRFVQAAYTSPAVKLPFVVFLFIGFMLSLLFGMVAVAIVQLFSSSRHSAA